MDSFTSALPDHQWVISMRVILLRAPLIRCLLAFRGCRLSSFARILNEAILCAR
jgi:hypothetical protein